MAPGLPPKAAACITRSPNAALFLLPAMMCIAHVAAAVEVAMQMLPLPVNDQAKASRRGFKVIQGGKN